MPFGGLPPPPPPELAFSTPPPAYKFAAGVIDNSFVRSIPKDNHAKTPEVTSAASKLYSTTGSDEAASEAKTESSARSVTS